MYIQTTDSYSTINGAGLKMRVLLGIFLVIFVMYASADSLVFSPSENPREKFLSGVEKKANPNFGRGLVVDPIPNSNNVPRPQVPPGIDLIQTASFNVNFNPASCQGTVSPWPSAASSAFSYATAIWGGLISSPITIEINACWRNDLNSNVLGSANSNFIFRDFAGAPVADTFYSAALADSLAGFDLNPGQADINANFNSNFANWYFGIDGNPPSFDFDFTSVVLHEVGHGLGFFGSMNFSGGQGLWGFGNPPRPTAYDLFATDGSGGVPLLSTSTYPNPSVALGNALTGQNVFFDGSNSVSANGGTPATLYAPSSWSLGSSFSHLDDGTYDATPNALMTHAIATGEVAHDPGPVGLAILVDQGWALNPIVNQVPEVVTPSVGSTLGAPSEVFTWTANGTNVDEWWIYAGASVGGNNYHDSGNLFSTLTETVSGLPSDGSTVYVRLWYRQTGSAWSFVDTTYLASNIGGPIEITSPAAGSSFTSSTVTFDWSSNGLLVDEWWLYLGSSTGSFDYHNSFSLLGALNTTVSGLPTDGSTVYARLWHRQTGGSWSFVDSTYTATTTALPSLASPVSGSTLTSGTQNISWSANGNNVDEWWIYVGSSVGANNHHDSGNLFSTLSTVISGLPTDGSTLHVRLWYRQTGGSWSFVDSTYIAASGAAIPSVTSPGSGSIINSPNELFIWSANGVLVDEWWIYAGSSVGANDYHDSGNLFSVASELVGNLPPSSPIFVRLWYRQTGGSWFFVDSTYSTN